MGVNLIVLPEVCDIGYDLQAIKKLAEALNLAGTR